MTIRNGQRNGTFDMGGGLRWQGGGGYAHLAGLILEDNHAAYLAGLDAEFAPPGDALELDTVVVRNNVATAAGAGVGASFSPGVTSFTMRNIQVYENSAYEGGGLYFQGDLQYSDQARIENSEVYANTASLSAGMENHGGSAAIPLEVVDSLFHDNQADFQGGAITNYGFMKLDRTTLEANGSGMDGGGLYNEEGATTDIVSSTISGKTAAPAAESTRPPPPSWPQ
jgi:hypothetical protein